MNTRLALIVLLGGLLVYGAFFLKPSKHYFEPEAAEAQLSERFEDYRSLRLAGKWMRMYDELLAPAHRKEVSPEEFLGLYGRGVMKEHAMDLVSIDVNEDARTAFVTARLTAELVVERMPPQFRKGFLDPEDPADLQRTQTFNMPWIWQEGQWYWPLLPDELDALRRARTDTGEVTLGGALEGGK